MNDHFQGGSLHIDYRGKIDRYFYAATIKRAVLTDSIFTVSHFEGQDELGPFTGDFKLSLGQDGFFRGDGRFKYSNGSDTYAHVALRRTADSPPCFAGTWHDLGDSEPYECAVELDQGD